MTNEVRYFAPYELRKGHEGDSCFDLKAWWEEEIIMRNLFPGDTLKIGTGAFFNIPEGYEVQVRGRSGLAASGILVHFGTVDSGYTGEVKVVLSNLSCLPFMIQRGTRIAQAFISKVPEISLKRASDKKDIEKESERGDQGFGSTGK